MKQLTLKDFINYGSPCISCGELHKLIVKIDPSFPTNTNKDIRPFLRDTYLEIEPQIKYKKYLTLWIFYKDNKISFSDLTDLANFLSENKIKLEKKCDKCNSSILSSNLEWNLSRQFLKPITIAASRLILQDEEYLYHIYNSYLDNKTIIMADKIVKSFLISPFKLEIPLIKINRNTKKDWLISKIKTYMTFS